MNPRFLSILTTCLLGAASLYSIEWRSIAPNPGEDINAIATTEDEVIFVGANNLIINYNPGSAWTRINVTNFTSYLLNFYSVASDSGGNLIVGGNHGTFMERRDGEWKFLRAEKGVSTWHGTAFEESGRAVLVGDGNIYLYDPNTKSWEYPTSSISSDQGNSWGNMFSFSDSFIQAGGEPVEFKDAVINDNQLYIAGDSPFIGYEASPWTGNFEVDLPIIFRIGEEPTLNINAVELGDSELLFGGSRFVNGVLRPAIFTLKNDQWFSLNVLYADANDGAITEIKYGPAGGIALAESGSVFISKNGDSWLRAPEPPGEPLCVGVSEDNFWIAGKGGIIARYVPSESDWTPSRQPSEWIIERQSLDTPSTGHIQLSSFAGIFFDRKLSITRDYGLTWTASPVAEFEELYGTFQDWELSEHAVRLQFFKSYPTVPLSDILADYEITIVQSSDAENWITEHQYRFQLSTESPPATQRNYHSRGNIIFQIDSAPIGGPTNSYSWTDTQITLLTDNGTSSLDPFKIKGRVQEISRNGNKIAIAGKWVSKHELDENPPLPYPVYKSFYGIFALVSKDGGESWTDIRWPLDTYDRNIVLEPIGSDYLVSMGGFTYLFGTDGSWNEINLPKMGQLTAIAYGAGICVIGNEESEIAVSEDLINWTVQKYPGFGPVESIAYGNGEFLVTNGQGQYLHGRTPFWSKDWAESQGWIFANWFGWIYPFPGSAWKWHVEHGWIYSPSSDMNGLWAWDNKMNSWWFTSDVWYPNVYSAEMKEWLYFVSKGSTRNFYSYGENGKTYHFDRN